MTNHRANTPSFVGPHEGREIELMLAGLKPMSMFLEPVDSDRECFPEEEFDKLVSEGKVIKHVAVGKSDPQGPAIRRVLYALPGEEWRINAVLLVQGLYDSLTPGWRPDLDRAIGLLLGYERADIEKFVARISERHGTKS